MKNGQQLTKTQKKQAIALRKRGISQARIAAAVGTSTATISRFLARARDAGERLPAARTGRPRRRREAPPPSVAAPERLAELREQVAALDPPALLEAARADYLPALGRIARRALDDDNVVVARDAIRLELEIAERLIASMPPPPVDPKDDPRNTAARDFVRNKLQQVARSRLANRAEREAAVLCPTCRARLAEIRQSGAAS